MKKHWFTTDAIRAVGGELNEEQNIVIVKLPLTGLRACGALDYLKNHTSLTVVVR